MSNVRLLAIEDEPLHAEVLRMAIEEAGFILIDVVDDIAAFKRLVIATKPDFLLIDIQLGAEIDGIELAKEISDQYQIPFVFVTSQQDMDTAKRAVEVLPAAYVTKPINAASLTAAIDIAEKNLMLSTNQTKSNFFFIKTNEGLQRINPEQFDYIEAQNKQCIIYHGELKEELTIKMKDLINQLPEHSFTRIHRSYIVNFDKVDLIDPSFQYVKLGGKEIPIGRQFKSEIMQRILKIG